MLRRHRSRSKLMWVLACLVLVAVVSGCGGVEGTYSHEEKMPDGSVVSVTLELKKGGVAVMRMAGDSGEGSGSFNVEGTYTVEGDKVTVKHMGGTDTYTLVDGNLTVTDGGETVTLKKK